MLPVHLSLAIRHAPHVKDGAPFFFHAVCDMHVVSRKIATLQLENPGKSPLRSQFQRRGLKYFIEITLVVAMLESALNEERHLLLCIA
jgi:hypothetical protein